MWKGNGGNLESEADDEEPHADEKERIDGDDFPAQDLVESVQVRGSRCAVNQSNPVKQKARGEGPRRKYLTDDSTDLGRVRKKPART